jgi:hypothetical protein
MESWGCPTTVAVPSSNHAPESRGSEGLQLSHKHSNNFQCLDKKGRGAVRPRSLDMWGAPWAGELKARLFFF